VSKGTITYSVAAVPAARADGTITVGGVTFTLARRGDSSPGPIAPALVSRDRSGFKVQVEFRVQGVRVPCLNHQTS
jgi:hypothetical protein